MRAHLGRYSHESIQPSLSSGKCSRFCIHSNYSLYHFFGINYVQAVPKLWQACNWKVFFYSHCLELGINGGWLSSWLTQASLTYSVIISLFIVPHCFQGKCVLTFQLNLEMLGANLPLQLQPQGKTLPPEWLAHPPLFSLPHWETLPFLGWQKDQPWASPTNAILLLRLFLKTSYLTRIGDSKASCTELWHSLHAYNMLLMFYDYLPSLYSLQVGTYLSFCKACSPQLST